MNNMVNIIIQLVCGAVGGVGAGKVMPKLSLGNAGNIIAGIVGGGLGGQILNLLGVGGGLDTAGILTSILGSGVGGGALLGIVSMVKGLISKK